jgi:hypothetical protein
MSKILRDDLDRLKDISNLLNELPDSHLEKINLREAALSAMDLAEKLAERIGPSIIIAPKKDGVHHVSREFQVEVPNPFPGPNISQEALSATATVKVTYEPTDDEIIFSDGLADHIRALEDICKRNEHDMGTYTTKEFNEQILEPLIATKKNVKAETLAIVGFCEGKTPGQPDEIINAITVKYPDIMPCGKDSKD